MHCSIGLIWIWKGAASERHDDWLWADPGEILCVFFFLFFFCHRCFAICLNTRWSTRYRFAVPRSRVRWSTNNNRCLIIRQFIHLLLRKTAAGRNGGQTVQSPANSWNQHCFLFLPASCVCVRVSPRAASTSVTSFHCASPPFQHSSRSLIHCWRVFLPDVIISPSAPRH